MTYNVFIGTLNLNQSLDEVQDSDAYFTTKQTSIPSIFFLIFKLFQLLIFLEGIL